MTDREVFKLGIINELLEGKEPNVNDYEGVDGLEKGEFNKLVDEMQKEGLIEGVVFSKAGDRLFVAFLNTAKVTKYGESYFENQINKL